MRTVKSSLFYSKGGVGLGPICPESRNIFDIFRTYQINLSIDIFSFEDGLRVVLGNSISGRDQAAGQSGDRLHMAYTSNLPYLNR